MFFSLSDAAKKVGISRSSIYRLIEEGKLSATTDHRGKKVVELTELLRVFGAIGQDETGQNKSQEDTKHKPVNVSGTASRTGQDTLVSAVQELERMRYQLQLKDMELKLKDKELELVQERLGDLKQITEQVSQEKNKLLEIIERQSLLLAAPKPQQAVSKPRSRAVKPAKARPLKAATTLKTASKPVAKPVPVKATPANAKKVLTTQVKAKVSTPAKAVKKRPTSKVAAKSGPKLSAKSKPITKSKR
jgi:excisionase family DNA binding protein